MLRLWLDPRRSMRNSSTIANRNNRNLFFSERLEGIYRFATGRLDSPAAPGVRSRNHVGLFDYLTLGLFYGVESFFRGYWIESINVRNAVSILSFPIWFPLNLVRATFGAVFTLLALAPLAVYHAVEARNVPAQPAVLPVQPPAAEVEVPAPAPAPEGETPAPAATERKTANPLARFLNSTSRSQEGTTKVVLQAISNPDDFRDLNMHPGNTEKSFWKITKNNDGTYDARLRNTEGKDPVTKLSRYSKVVSNADNTESFMTRAKETLGKKADKLGEAKLDNHLMFATPKKVKPLAKNEATASIAYIPATIRR